VLKGDMSLVGPRPHPLDDYGQYSLDDLRRLEVKPGITGLWQVTARQDPSFQTSMELDIRYIETWSLRLDLSVLLRTVRVVILGEGS
jgi:lipopolysaccharide/colanic/teichoic acid biosynthesis glycosyltransferase